MFKNIPTQKKIQSR